jgi:hypothetical protein
VQSSGNTKRSRSSALLALFETIAVAFHLEDVDAVREPIDQRTGKPLGAEDAGPFVDRPIAGEDGGAALVALGEQLELMMPERRMPN